ncbi:MAG: RNA polymerase sigma factor [Acidimicrobiia bacterium]
MGQEELVAAARGGDQEAFEELVRQTYVTTYTLAYRLTGNEEDARDVVQETYLRAWKAVRRFRGDAQFSTWLYRITANTSSSMTKRRSRTRAEALPESGPDVIDERLFANPEASSEASALHERLATAVAELPPKLRAIVVLKDIYDLPHEAIAAELGISVAAAKVRLHRARKRLRDVLFEERGGVARAV